MWAVVVKAWECMMPTVCTASGKVVPQKGHVVQMYQERRSE